MAFTIREHEHTTEHIREYYATGSGALAETLPARGDYCIVEVRLHLGSAATQEDFTVDIDSGIAAAYDTNLLTVDMSQDIDGNAGVVTDVVWRPEERPIISKSDEVDFAWTNTDAATWGLNVLIERKG